MRHENFPPNYLERYYANPDQLILQEKNKNDKKYNDFIERINEFNEIKTLTEAKQLASKILPVVNQINFFTIGYAKCTVINKDNLFRITLDSEKEFICYNFE